MANLKGSKTEANLMAAFSGESQARNKYTYYASQAKKDGYEQIAAIFLETAENEKEHAKMWFKALNGGKVPDTITNLKDYQKGREELETAVRLDPYNLRAKDALDRLIKKKFKDGKPKKGLFRR